MESYYNVEQWMTEIDRYANDSVSKLRVRNRCDLMENKVVDPQKSKMSYFFQIFERLFSDSEPRLSTRLAGEAAASSNSVATTIAGIRINHSSEYLGGPNLSSVTLWAVTVRKGQSWANECFEEGVWQVVLEDSRSSVASEILSPKEFWRRLQINLHAYVPGDAKLDSHHAYMFMFSFDRKAKTERCLLQTVDGYASIARRSLIARLKLFTSTWRGAKKR